MKTKILLLLFALLLPVSLMAADDEKPQIKFEKTMHDFGRIDAANGPVTAVYRFTNVGKVPAIIVSVTNGGCGCTRPKFTTAPIKPGESGEVSITFDPEGRSGSLYRQVQVQVSGLKKRYGLKFKGSVIPAPKEDKK